MLPETAYIKLAWALGNSDTKEKALDLFKSNIAGEIKEREKYNEFPSD